MSKPFPVSLKSIRSFVFLMALFFAISIQNLMAQDRKPDVIIRKDNTKVEAVIFEVSDKEVKYKRYGDKDGPTFTIGKENIASILYANGDVENLVPSFERPTSDNPPLYQQRSGSGAATRYLPGNPREFSNEQLKFNEQFCYGKSTKFRKMGLTGVIGGSLLTLTGILLIDSGVRSANSYYGTSSSSQSSDEAKIGMGSLLFVAGLGGGITLTAIGFSKTKSYARKAKMNGAELRKRGLSYINFQPRIDPLKRTAGLGLAMTF